MCLIPNTVTIYLTCVFNIYKFMYGKCTGCIALDVVTSYYIYILHNLIECLSKLLARLFDCGKLPAKMCKQLIGVLLRVGLGGTG
jgi:hypothetical protein